jgi:hypothetical protein
MATPTQKKFIEALRSHGAEISDEIVELAVMDLKKPKKTSDASKDEAPTKEAKSTKKKAEKPVTEDETTPVKEKKSRKTKAEEPKPEGGATEKEPKSPKVKAEKPETTQPVRMSRMTKAVKDMILAVDASANDKTFKDFKTYINELTDDDFKSCSLKEHVDKFVECMKGPETKEELSEKKEPVEVSLEDVRKRPDDYIIVDVSAYQIKAVDATSAADLIVNVPREACDGDVEEVKFHERDYVVSTKYGRVYQVHPTGDIFRGFLGIGEFATMKV